MQTRTAVLSKTRAALLLLLWIAGPAGGFDLQGHRGARGLMPENTLPAFALALEIGVSTLELDLAVTRDREVVVMHDHVEIARSGSALRVLETASPPTVYVPAADIDTSLLVPVPHQSFCEWKGTAAYLALADDTEAIPVAWLYPEPHAAFSMLRDHFAFYPGRVDCFLDDEAVQPQHSEFYGGWITSEIVGPFKGDPGTQGW